MSTPKMLSEKQAASYLNVSVRTLQDWRRKRFGPSYTKLGSRVRYPSSAINQFVEANQVDPKSK